VDEDYVNQLEVDLEKLKAEKEVGSWVDSSTLLQKNQENEILRQENARLTEKNKKQVTQIEEIKREQVEWSDKEGKYKKVVENLKNSILELKKKEAHAESNAQFTQTFDNLFLKDKECMQRYLPELNTVYAVITELTAENQHLKEDRLRRRNQPANYLLSSLEMFEEF
jgi:hypothetical protein